jgi:energy-coupling factor transporter ATP-binding protein EcfA2
MDSDMVYIGQRENWGGDTTLFGVPEADRRHHLYVIGQTGSGKTTLLRNLIVQHIVAGHGVGLIDPHGDLADDLLNHIPPWRADHLVYFNPGDLDFPIGLNLLANVPPDERHLVASGLVGAFKSLWRDSWGPRLEYILYNALAALLECQNTTLVCVSRLLTDPQYREWVVRQVRDPFIRAFWAEEYASYDPRFMREAIAPIQNKLGQFLLNPVVRNILGQVRCKVSFRFMMDNQRLFIANLAKGRLGHDKANLLGSLLTTQFQLAAMARTDQPEQDRRDFYLFIDEFQNFSTDAFAAILAEARKYRLCLTLSHQYIDQLSLPIRQAVFGNVGTLVAFRVGHTDAQVLENEFGKNFSASQFVELDRYQVLVKLLENGTHREPFRAAAIPPLQTHRGRREKLISRSRERFTSPRGEVETKLTRWMAGQPEPVTVESSPLGGAVSPTALAR